VLAFALSLFGHGQREMLAPEDIGTFRGDLIHYNFSKGISEWMIKHARYARDEAISADASIELNGLRQVLRAMDSVERRRALKRLSESLPLRPLLRFAYLYFWRLGFLDGRGGFRYAMLIAIYQWMIDMNRFENFKGE
jgi:hypothetical protein